MKNMLFCEKLFVICVSVLGVMVVGYVVFNWFDKKMD